MLRCMWMEGESCGNKKMIYGRWYQRMSIGGALKQPIATDVACPIPRQRAKHKVKSHPDAHACSRKSGANATGHSARPGATDPHTPYSRLKHPPHSRVDAALVHARVTLRIYLGGANEMDGNRPHA